MHTMRIANILIIMGVLAWLPFFWLLARGAHPNLLPYLAFHLAGVLSGAWLRSRQAAGAKAAAIGQTRVLAGTVMIYLGVLAWGPYLYLTRVAGVDVEITGFLAAHLTGVLGGAALRGSVALQRLAERRRDADGTDG